MVEEPQVPPVAEMLRWIEDVVAQGIRRPGYPADRWAEDFVHRAFGSLGLEAVRFEPVESAYWIDRRGALTVVGDQSTEAIDCFSVPLSEPSLVDGQLARWDPADPSAVAGKIALYELHFGALPDEFPVLRRRATGDCPSSSPAALAEAGWAFDPDGTFSDGRHRLPFATEMQETMEPAISAGAIGYVGVLRGYPSGGCEYYVPYDGRFRSIPGVYVSESSGDRLLAFLESGPAKATVEVVAERGVTVSRKRRRRAAGSGRRMGHRRDPSRRPMGLGSGGRHRDSDVVGPGNRVGSGARVGAPAPPDLRRDCRAHVARRRHARVHRAPSSDDGSRGARASSGARRTR